MKFLTSLRVKACFDGHWQLLSDFRLEAVNGEQYTVPRNFVTDFASVPRLPLLYWLMGGRGIAAATLHDMLYRWQLVRRKRADQLFLQALICEDALLLVGRSCWICAFLAPLHYLRQRVMYLGVRMFGFRAYGSRAGGCLDPRKVCLTPCEGCPYYKPGWRKLNERTS